MAKLSRAQREWRPNMPKKARSIKVMFASTVLGLEAFVVFFATLVAFGLLELPKALILSVGLVLSVLLVLACAVLKKPWGYGVGWILQLILIATGFLVPMMFFVGVLFALTWWYGLRSGARLDRENVQRAREQEQWERDHPEEAGDNGVQQDGTAPDA